MKRVDNQEELDTRLTTLRLRVIQNLERAASWVSSVPDFETERFRVFITLRNDEDLFGGIS